MRRAAALLALGALSALRPTAAPADAPPPLAAHALYDAAYDRWRALPVPAFATYAALGSATSKGRVQAWKADVWYRASDGRCTVVPVALDAHDRPGPPDFRDRCLAPGYAFTFVPQRHGGGGSALPLDVPTPEPSADADLKTIGSISVRSRPYAVTLAGDEEVDGKPVAHLILRPFGDPSKHILRELWIDRATLGVVRLRGEAWANAHLIRIQFEADYDESEGEQTLRRVSGYGKAQLLLLKVGADFALALDRFGYPAAVPDWVFDRKSYAAHGGPPPP